MKYEAYKDLKISPDRLKYEFTSTGPKGNIRMVVQFEETAFFSFVNLAFGIVLPDGTLDDVAKTNNHDRNKILSTISRAVYDFTTLYPYKTVYFTGSTATRTRLYRIAVTVNLEELLKYFEVFGVYILESGIYHEKFKKEMPYTGFAVKRKE